MNAQCYANGVQLQFDGDVVDNPVWRDGKGERTLSDCLLDCSLASDVNGRPCADLSTLESEVATTTANLASTDVAVGDLSSRLDSTEQSVQNDYAALENRLAEIETWKAAWQ